MNNRVESSQTVSSVVAGDLSERITFEINKSQETSSGFLFNKPPVDKGIQ
jgi:hypothetical protein